MPDTHFPSKALCPDCPVGFFCQYNLNLQCPKRKTVSSRLTDLWFPCLLAWLELSQIHLGRHLKNKVLLHEQRTSLLDSECQDVVYIAPMTNEEGFRMSRAVCTYGGGILSYTQCPSARPARGARRSSHVWSTAPVSPRSPARWTAAARRRVSGYAAGLAEPMAERSSRIRGMPRLTPPEIEGCVAPSRRELVLTLCGPSTVASAQRVYTWHYSSWQSGKVERMNRSLAQELQHARAWGGRGREGARSPGLIEHYN